MAITSVKEIIEAEFTLDIDGGDAKREFYVTTDDPSESYVTIWLATGIVYGDGHPNDAGKQMYEVDVRRDPQSELVFRVEFRYQRLGTELTELEVNPLLRAPRISMGGDIEQFTAPGVIDETTGTLVGVFANSAGEPYDPQPVEELDIPWINIVRNEASAISVSLFYSYRNAVNSDVFTFGDLVVPAGFAKVLMSAGETQEWADPATPSNITFYREITYRIRLHPLSWDINLLDAGSFFFFDSDTRKSFVTDQEPREPFIGLLNGSGGRLDDEPGTPDPVYNVFPNRRRLPFSALSLPSGP